MVKSIGFPSSISPYRSALERLWKDLCASWPCLRTTSRRTNSSDLEKSKSKVNPQGHVPFYEGKIPLRVKQKEEEKLLRPVMDMGDTDSLANFQFIVEGILLTTISTLGIIGTSMSIVVLFKPRLNKDVFFNFLTGLAVCDTIFLFFAILLFGLPALWKWYGMNVSVHIIPFSHGAIHVARMGSVYITMAVTLERYFAVVHPLRKFWLKKYLLPGVALFAVAYNIPKFFELENYIWPFTNETDVRETKLKQNPYYESYYVFWSKIILMEVIPYTVLIVLNTFIVVKLFRSSKFRRNITREQTSNNLTCRTSHNASNREVKYSNSHHGLHPCSQSMALSAPSEGGRNRSSSMVSNPENLPNRNANETAITAEERRRRFFGAKKFHTIDTDSFKLANFARRNRMSNRAKEGTGLSGAPVTASPATQPAPGDDNTLEASPLRQHSPPELIRGDSASDFSGNPSAALSRQTGSTHTNPSNSQHQNHPHVRKQEAHLALTLVAISLLFIICQMVKIITDIYELSCVKIHLGGKLVCASTGFIDRAVCLANLSACINSAANFLVYMLRGKKFRDLFLETYFGRKRRYGAAIASTAAVHGASGCHPGMSTRPRHHHASTISRANCVSPTLTSEHRNAKQLKSSATGRSDQRNHAQHRPSVTSNGNSFSPTTLAERASWRRNRLALRLLNYGDRTKKEGGTGSSSLSTNNSSKDKEELDEMDELVTHV